ncbi:MAG: DUF3987 domain-containing protein, partial [Proteobacteria bacterium]|nr:DUF3987 domain-containing protein [Pseudomonadota bacterium]
TSPGNYQFGFLLTERLYDMGLADRIGKAIIKAGLSDPGAGGLPTRYARLPQGWNSKHNPPFRCQLRAFNPERTYTVQELVDGLGLELDQPKTERKPAPGIITTESSAYGRKALETECQAVASEPQGSRNARLNQAAFAVGQLAAGGEIQEEEARLALEQAAAACGLDESEAGKTIASGLSAGMQEPRQAPGESDWSQGAGLSAPLSPWPETIPFDEQPPDLPVDILPGILGKFSEGLAHATQTPRELAAVNVLGVVALAVQHKLIVRVKPDYSEGLNIYAICASEPGERKSAIVSACKAPLVEWEIAQEAFSMDEIREAMSRRKTMEKAIDKARNKAAGAKTADERRQAADEICQMERELPEVPSLPRLLVDDVTPEALASVMAGSGESIGMLEAEGGALDTLSGRYSNGVPNIDLFLKAFGAEPVIVDRKGKEPLRLRKPRLTMVLTPQPSVLRAAGSNEVFMGRGLIARCLLVLPRPLVGFRDNSQTIPPDLTQKWTAYVNSLLALPGQATPRELTLTPEAFSLWLDFSNDVEVAQRPGGEFEFMRAWASKLTGLVVRLAGLLHMAQGLPAIHMAIGLETMRNAVMLATWAAEHAKHVYSCFGLDDGQEAAKRALEWIGKERRETVKAREILRALSGRFPTMEKVRPGLEMLVDRGFLVPLDSGRPSPKGGRPSETYSVNPAVYEVPTC